eukprot:GHVS01030320.1.p1 GENE.GHVS01030320.1~~GHVS01030320.1.p1  ORF type:complete len:232 (+),score=44.77 GHVS01030320.1:160-855(+)
MVFLFPRATTISGGARTATAAAGLPPLSRPSPSGGGTFLWWAISQKGRRTREGRVTPSSVGIAAASTPLCVVIHSRFASGTCGRSLCSGDGFLRRFLLEHRGFSSVGNEDWENATINVTFILKNGEAQTVKAPEGVSILEVAHHYGIDLEGACEASLACSTCHVYVDKNFFDLLPPPVEEEDDMLDMAPALTSRSRLGCQIILTKKLDGLTVMLPPMTKNFYVDGHIPQAH